MARTTPWDGEASPPDLTAESGQGLYIQQAAQMVGASPVQLRQWEQQRLIAPARTPSGYRIYTIADIERMRRIRSLMAGGVNAEGVRRILDSAGDSRGDRTVGATAAPAHSRGVGQTIRNLRKSHDMTLRDVAAMTGLSPSYISSVERGNAAPSIASMQKIGAVFETNVLNLMTDSYEAPSLLVRADSRREIDLGKGVRVEDMSTVDSSLETLLFTIQPGCGTDGPITHEGEEVLFVISGRLYLRLDGSDDYYLDPGDSMTFSSERAHEFGNPTEDALTVVLWVITPRTF